MCQLSVNYTRLCTLRVFFLLIVLESGQAEVVAIPPVRVT